MKEVSNRTNDQDFSAWSDRVERHFIRWIAILTVLLAFSQLLLQFPAARHLLTTTDESEGVPYHRRPNR